MAFSGLKAPTGKEYLLNLESKMNDRLFVGDTEGILRPGIEYVPALAFEAVKNTFVERM
jgi:hypothetical protein